MDDIWEGPYYNRFSALPLVLARFAEAGVPSEKIRLLPVVGPHFGPEVFITPEDRATWPAIVASAPAAPPFLRLCINIRPDNRLAWLLPLLLAGLPQEDDVAKRARMGETWIEWVYRTAEETDEEAPFAGAEEEENLTDYLAQQMAARFPQMQPSVVREFAEIFHTHILRAVAYVDRLNGFTYDPDLTKARSQTAVLRGLELPVFLEETLKRSWEGASYLGVDNRMLSDCQFSELDRSELVCLAVQRRWETERFETFTAAVHRFVSSGSRVIFQPLRSTPCCMDSPFSLLDFTAWLDDTIPVLMPEVVVELAPLEGVDQQLQEKRLALLRRLFLPAYVSLRVDIGEDKRSSVR